MRGTRICSLFQHSPIFTIVSFSPLFSHCLAAQRNKHLLPYVFPSSPHTGSKILGQGQIASSSFFVIPCLSAIVCSTKNAATSMNKIPNLNCFIFSSESRYNYLIIFFQAFDLLSLLWIVDAILNIFNFAQLFISHSPFNTIQY